MKKLAIPENLTAMAYKSIKAYILDGDLNHHSRLTEEFLSGQLGISKSPIREALNRLESEGLIRIEPRRGAYLRQYSAKESDELYDFREALEVHVVRTAKLTGDLLDRLDESILRQREYLETRNTIEFILEDMNFHAILARGSSNQMLQRELERLQNIMWLHRRHKVEVLHEGSIQGHRAVLDALRSGDREEAQTAMRQHISRVRHNLVQEILAQEAASGDVRANVVT